MVRVGINGFGRIGRLTFRYAWDMPELEIVHVNELVGGSETAAYLVKFDSVHGPWAGKEVEAQGSGAFVRVALGLRVSPSPCPPLAHPEVAGSTRASAERERHSRGVQRGAGLHKGGLEVRRC